MSRHTVFDGIDLLFLDVKEESVQFYAKSHTKTFAINHCEEGRIECKFTSGEYLYMGPGDMSLGWHTHADYQHKNYFPTKLFKGIVLLVDVEKAQPVLDSLVSESHINLTTLAERFCEHSEYGMMMEETESVRQIFSSLYKVPDQIKGHYFKLKVIEIFLLLSVISTSNNEKRATYRKQQVDIVKAVNEYVSTQFMKRITIETLSEQFDVPTSTLKRCFKGVYGTTIHQYLKECRINAAKRNGRRIIAVGTTSVRTLESATNDDGVLQGISGWTQIFIYPGYKFKMIDALVTNFHLPQSTLLMLISALAGREHCLAAYEEAVRERYRFFSFGDAMFIR